MAHRPRGTLQLLWPSVALRKSSVLKNLASLWFAQRPGAFSPWLPAARAGPNAITLR